jgi:hypothetical protein
MAVLLGLVVTTALVPVSVAGKATLALVHLLLGMRNLRRSRLNRHTSASGVSVRIRCVDVVVMIDAAPVLRCRLLRGGRDVVYAAASGLTVALGNVRRRGILVVNATTLPSVSTAFRCRRRIVLPVVHLRRKQNRRC